ncbi:MAG: hypothetical protein AB7N65_03775 [Vicinamibacterales bacterium]
MSILEYELRTFHPTKRGNVRLRVEANGEIFGTRNRSEPAAGDWVDDWAAPLRTVANPDATVTALLESGGFFAMPEEFAGDGPDGVREMLRYSGSRGVRSVVVTRSDVPAVQALVSRLFWGLGVAQALL